MASPFRYFRKHQKPFIVVAAILCIFVFVLSDWLMSLIRNAAEGGGGPRSSQSVAVSWDGGKLNERELARFRARRIFLSQFLRLLLNTGAQRILADGGSPTQPNIPNFLLRQEVSQQEVEQDVVMTQVMADLAMRAGIWVSDETINHYLREAGFGRVGGSELVDLLKRVPMAGWQPTVDVLFAALRDNLLAVTYENGTMYASRIILPEQRWEDWRRVNDQISLEAALLPTDRFVADVPEPSDGQIRAYYERYKNQEPARLQNVMGSLLPAPGTGFTQPRRVRLHYLLGDVITWSEKLLASVTDDQIEDYYHRNKRTQFVRADTTELDPTKNSSANTPDGQDSVSAEDPEQYQSLEEVRDRIKLHLSTDMAVAQLKETFENLTYRLRKVYNPYSEEMVIASAKGKPLPEPPAILADLSGVAEEYGLVLEKTPLLSRLQLSHDSLVGKATDTRTGRNNVTQLMFGQLDLYDPAVAQDIDGNWYLALKVEDVPRTVPPLDELWDEVIRAWKYEEASKLALEKAQSFASECQAVGATLGEFFSDESTFDGGACEVVTTDRFSELNYSVAQTNPQQGPRLSEVPPLTAVGPELMTEAFQLKEGQVVGVWNHDRSSAYVIRLHSRLRSEEELRQLFLQEASSWSGLRSAQYGRWQQFQREVFDQLTKRVGLKFEEGRD